MRPGCALVVVIALVLAACASTSPPPIDPDAVAEEVIRAAPVTTHESPTTTLPGRPSVGEGPENPMPLGEAITVGGWDILVSGRTESPVTGSSAVLVAVQVTADYVRRPGRGSFHTDVITSALGGGDSWYRRVEAACSESLTGPTGAISAQTMSGNLCFLIEGAVGDLLLVVEDPNSPTPHRVFLSTR